jgi:hypothetical protein
MIKYRYSFLFFFFLCGLVLQPHWIRADSAETAVQIEKGDVVWSQKDATNLQIYFSACENVEGGWSSPVKITNDSYINGHPVIDAGLDGKRWLVWTADTGSDYIVRYAVGKDNTWSEPAAIPAQLHENLAPSVAVDSSGVTWVVWSANDGGQDEIYFSQYSGNTWTTPMLVNRGNDVPDILPILSLDEQGKPQVTWEGFRDGSYVKLRSSWNGEAWSDEAEVQATSQETAGESERSIANMPSFIEYPEEAYVRVYKSSIVK